MTFTLLPHQRRAAVVLKEMLRMFGGAILADAPGSGKSYAALELIRSAITDGQRVVVVSPATLRMQWRTLLDVFSGDIEIVSHDSLRTWPIVPGSYADALVVVDEAHRFRNPSSERSLALARLVVNARTLFLTATPFCNSPRDLFALIELFAADDRFAALGVSSLREAINRNDDAALRRILHSVMLRRTRSELQLDESTPATREHLTFFPPPSNAPELVRAIERMTFPGVALSARALCRQLLLRHAASSVAAFSAALRRQRRYLSYVMSEGTQAFSKPAFLRLFGAEEATAVQQLIFREFWDGAIAAIEGHAIEDEIAIIDGALRELAHSGDSKRDVLIERLDSLPRPALLFTHSVDTARALFSTCEAVRRRAILTSRIIATSHMRTTGPDVIAHFNRGEIDLLIATDLASEGLNLQAAASVIHYDVPWNHVKLLQRNGRAARLGSRQREVMVELFICSDARFNETLPIVQRKMRAEAELFKLADDRDADEADVGLPAVVDRASPQALLWRALERASLFDVELRRLVTLRYPRGIELVMREYAAERLDGRKVSSLRDLLRRGARWRQRG